MRPGRGGGGGRGGGCATGGKSRKFCDDDQTTMAFTCGGSFDQVVSYIQAIDGPKRLARLGG